MIYNTYIFISNILIIYMLLLIVITCLNIVGLLASLIYLITNKYFHIKLDILNTVDDYISKLNDIFMKSMPWMLLLLMVDVCCAIYLKVGIFAL